jgi:protein tyrosine/serine phosphatase
MGLLNKLTKVIDQGHCVLVHSHRGANRAVMVVAGYLMLKYSWTVRKALEFIETKKKIDLKMVYYQQLLRFEQILKEKGKNLTNIWMPMNFLDLRRNEEIMMNNTYLNLKGAVNVSFGFYSFFSTCRWMS